MGSWTTPSSSPTHRRRDGCLDEGRPGHLRPPTGHVAAHEQVLSRRSGSCGRCCVRSAGERLGRRTFPTCKEPTGAAAAAHEAGPRHAVSVLSAAPKSECILQMPLLPLWTRRGDAVLHVAGSTDPAENSVAGSVDAEQLPEGGG